jgi:hypothetical protein
MNLNIQRLLEKLAGIPCLVLGRSEVKWVYFHYYFIIFIIKILFALTTILILIIIILLLA